MKNFTYRSHEEKENIEEILRQRKRKINRQQIVAGTVLGVIIAVIALYIGRQVYYTDFDGYIHVDANQIRTPFDIFLDSLYVETGDVVLPGDTLYSYYMMDMMVENANYNTEPAIVARNRDLTLRYNNILQQIQVLKVRIAELRKQISLEDHNIQFGLSDNSHKMDLERMLSEALAQLKAMQNELAMLGGMRHATDPVRRGIHSSGTREAGSQIYDNIKSDALKDTRNFRLATDSAIIVNIVAPDRMIFFEKELLMTLQHLNLLDNNVHVVAYIPVDQINRITYNSNVEVIVNENISFEAHVSLLGARTEVIPEHLRSYFTKKNTALIANLELDYDQTIPFWSVASGLPVTVRVRNLETWQSDSPNNYLWVTTGEGVHHESLESFIKRRRHYNVTERRLEEARQDSIKRAKAKALRDSIEAAKEREKADAEAKARIPDSLKVYRIMTNVFRSEANADKRVEELRKLHLSGSGKMMRSGRWYVYAGAYADMDEARKNLNRLTKSSHEFRDAWILDTRKPESND